MSSSQLLSTTDTATPDSDVIKNAWGEYQLYCKTYGTAAVKFQIRLNGESDSDWNTAVFNGNDIELTAAGEVLDIRLVQGYEYRLSTATAGAVVYISPYTVKFNPNP